jgi:hypothetical protein
MLLSSGNRKAPLQDLQLIGGDALEGLSLVNIEMAPGIALNFVPRPLRCVKSSQHRSFALFGPGAEVQAASRPAS